MRSEGEVEAGGERIHHIASVEVEKRPVCPTKETAASLDLPRHSEGPGPPLLPPHSEVQAPALSTALHHHLDTA